MKQQIEGSSGPCKHCVLRGCHGKHSKSMVPTFPLNQILKCAKYGVDVATCVICSQQCVAQRAKKFTTRWPSHQSRNQLILSGGGVWMTVKRVFEKFGGDCPPPWLRVVVDLGLGGSRQSWKVALWWRHPTLSTVLRPF